MIAPILLAGAVLVVGTALAFALRSNAARAAAAIGTQAIASAAVLAAVIPVLRGGAELSGSTRWSFPIETIDFRVDALSAFFLAWSLPMTLLGTIYAVGYLRPYFEAGRNGGPHFALLNLTSLAFVIIYSVQNAMVFLLGWEIAAVAAWLLVIWDYRNQKIRFAGFNYLVSTQVGLFVLVAAFMLMYAQTGSMTFDAFAGFISRQSRLRSIVFVLLGASFALKSAFFPFHTWLPRAHSAAPAHVSALMSGVIHKAGLFAFLRFTLLMGRPEEWMGWGVLGFGALSAFVAVLYTSAQRDMKRLLGYSSTENVGIAAMGFGVGYLGLCWNKPTLVALGFCGGLLHLFNHALFKCLLFYAAGAVYRQTHTVDLERLGGLLRKMPRTGALFLVGAIAIAALPPLNGFVSEFVIYSGLLRGQAPSATANAAFVCAAALLAFVGAVSAMSMVRAFGLAFLGQPRDTSIHEAHEVPPSMLAPMYLHAAGIVLVGLAPSAALIMARPAGALFGAPGLPLIVDRTLEPLRNATLILAGLTAIVVLVGWWSGRKAASTAKTHATWGCGYTAPNRRMQYTGSSFSAQFATIFEGVLPQLRREQLPKGVFPEGRGHLSTHYVDAVERRTFEVLGQGEEMVTRASEHVSEEPRFSFAAGLLTLVILVGLLIGVGR
ncbi:MAG: proton-conducting transporter transmembrane domain-containing protein [Polyangiales bacterium]